jgi:methionyl aminopeptidase
MNDVSIKTGRQLEAVRASGKGLAKVLGALITHVRPGISTWELGELAEDLIRKAGGVPIFKGYGAEWGKPFPAAVCVSINDEVVHGIPSRERILAEGDIVKLDIGMRFEGMVTDMARTVPVGKIDAASEKLLRVTEESLLRGIRKIHSGARLADFARAVQGHVEREGFSVVRDLVGHGVGHELHEDPQIPNFFIKGMDNFSFLKGMVVALEPMVNAGKFPVRVGPDGWTYVTKDGSRSAHFEDTVIVTERGNEIVTRFQ